MSRSIYFGQWFMDEVDTKVDHEDTKESVYLWGRLHGKKYKSPSPTRPSRIIRLLRCSLDTLCTCAVIFLIFNRLCLFQL